MRLLIALAATLVALGATAAPSQARSEGPVEADLSYASSMFLGAPWGAPTTRCPAHHGRYGFVCRTRWAAPATVEGSPRVVCRVRWRVTRKDYLGTDPECAGMALASRLGAR